MLFTHHDASRDHGTCSKFGAVAYREIPLFCREFRYYRMLTGKANLMLKEGLKEDEIIATLINKYVRPITQQAIKKERRVIKAKRVRVTRTQKPPYLQLPAVENGGSGSIGKGKASDIPWKRWIQCLSV